jgi:hypothetical protein
MAVTAGACVSDVGCVEGADAVAATKEPSARLTSLRDGCFPLKYSAAVREGSVDGTGGYMSDWKESA